MGEQPVASRIVLTGASALLVLLLCPLWGCSSHAQEEPSASSVAFEEGHLQEAPQSEDDEAALAERQAEQEAHAAELAQVEAQEAQQKRVEEARAKLDLTQDVRTSFLHGDKPAEHQKYIVLHDTEGNSSASSVIDWWDSNGAGVAAHFVVNKDGSIVQAVPLDKITHHAGYGDTGHNQEFGVVEDGRDDMVGTVPIGSWASDYGMNGSSIGIEIVHVGGSGAYPQAQLDALDDLIAYIDAYYGFESPITDHKAWRSGNSDTSPEFAEHLESYQTTRTHA